MSGAVVGVPGVAAMHPGQGGTQGVKGVDQGHSSPDGGEGKGNKVDEEEGVAQAAADG